MPNPDAPVYSQNLTPSEIVLLHCDKFAPAPRQWRIMFELSLAWPFLLGAFFGMGFALGKADPSTPTSQAIGAVVAIGCAVGWWFYRRGKDPVVDRDDVAVIRPLEGKRAAVSEDLLLAMLSAAVLANERTAAGEMELVDGGLVARFRPGASPWPPDSLEEELRRERDIPVSEMIYDWLADNSHFPHARAWKLIRHSVVLRERAGAVFFDGEAERTVDWAPVQAWLNECKERRPEVWKALQKSIGKGLKDRTVPPRQKNVGGKEIPEYYYQEIPVGALEAAQGGATGAQATPEPTIEGQKVPAWVNAVVLLLALGGVAWALGRHPDHVAAAAVNAVIILSMTVIGEVLTYRWRKLNAVRAKYGLPPEEYQTTVVRIAAPHQSRFEQALSTAAFATVMAIPGAVWGMVTAAAALFFPGLAWMVATSDYNNFRKKTAQEVVRARVDALSKEAPTAGEADVAIHATADEGPPMVSLVPEEPVPAYELPAPTAEMRGRLSEHSRRPAKPLRLVLLRVFGSAAYNDLVELIKPWRRVGSIEHLEGYDTVAESLPVQQAVEHGDVDRALVKNLEEVQAQLAQASTEWNAKEGFPRHAFQCTNAVWRQAILMMLQRADAVLMDLSSLSVENQGCAWELGQMLDRVPLGKVTLLVNENTDLECLRTILDLAAAKMPADSPSRNDASARWQLVQVGGLAERHANESYYEWKRRMDRRLDPVQLAAWLLKTAGGAAS